MQATFQYGLGIRSDVPGTPNPMRLVQLQQTVPFVEVVFSKNNPVQEQVVGNQTHLPLFMVELSIVVLAADCKSANVGPIPTSISNFTMAL